MFNNDYAKYLGIDDFRNVSQDHKIYLTGIGGQKNENIAYFHNVDLYIYLDQKHLDNKKVIPVKNIEVAFLEKNFDIGGILGVYGFLDRVTFLTNIKDSYFEISPLFEADL